MAGGGRTASIRPVCGCARLSCRRVAPMCSCGCPRSTSALVVVQREAVAGRPRLDGCGPQALPQAYDTALHDLRPGSRNLTAPQGVRQCLGADRFTGSYDQCREHHTIPRAEPVGVAVDLERAKYGDAHPSTLDLPLGESTALLPD